MRVALLCQISGYATGQPIFKKFIPGTTTPTQTGVRWKPTHATPSLYQSVSFEQLFDKDIFASYENLQTKSVLPQTHLFRCFQARDSVCCNVPNFPHKPTCALIDASVSLPAICGFIFTAITVNAWKKEVVPCRMKGGSFFQS